jgi:hypothetical protein
MAPEIIGLQSGGGPFVFPLRGQVGFVLCGGVVAVYSQRRGQLTVVWLLHSEVCVQLTSTGLVQPSWEAGTIFFEMFTGDFLFSCTHSMGLRFDATQNLRILLGRMESALRWWR